MFSCSFTAALLAHIRGGNVFSLLVGMMLISNGLLAQLSINITQPNLSVPNFRITTSVSNPVPYDPLYYNHQGSEYIAVMTFRFRNAANATIYTTQLPISFKGNDYGVAWTNTALITQYAIGPCPGMSVKSVEISTAFSNPNEVGNDYNLTINYPDGNSTGPLSMNASNQTSISKLITFSNAISSNAALTTAIQPSIYHCNFVNAGVNTGSGYLLYAYTTGGCPIQNTNAYYGSYTTAWRDNTTNQTMSFMPIGGFDWSGLPEIGNNGTDIVGVIMATPGHNYTVTVTDANGTTTTASYNVPTQIPNQFTYQVTNNANCTNNLTISSPLVGFHTELELIQNGTHIYDEVVSVANNSYSHTFPNIASGDYILKIRGTVESAYYCTDEIPIHIGATITSSQTNGCITQLTANAGGNSYAWSNGATTQSITTTGNNTATYTVTVTNATVCSTASYSITQADVVACCQNANNYQINVPIYTATSATWSPSGNPFGNVGNINVNGTIVVPNGVTLTINNMAMNFSTIGKIVVQKGGRLNLNATTLDGLCNSMWLGIQVEGNGSSIIPSPVPAGYQYPGRVYTNTNTIIRNAVIGITNTILGDLSINGIAQALLYYTEPLPPEIGTLSSWILANYLWTTNATTKAGGVVNVQNTTFTNCFQGINLSWRGHKFNRIENSRFDVLGSSLPYPFTNPPVSTMTNRPEAGVALMGTTIDELGTSWALTSIKTCTFSLYKFGIRSNFINTLTIEDCQFSGHIIGTSLAHFLEDPNSLIKVRQNTYSSCKLAIQASGVDNLSIRDNHINETFTGMADGNRIVGIYARGCNPILRNNTIGSTQYGIILTDTEADGSIMGGNVTNFNNVSFIAEGDNTGLTTRCNHFLNRYSYGIKVRPWASNNEAGDLGHQGLCDENQPAAFTFTSAIQDFTPFHIHLLENTNPFILEDIGAESLLVSAPLDNFTGINCDELPATFNLNDYCSLLGYTSIADIEGLIGSGGIQDKAIAEVFLNYLEADNYTAALELLYAYENRLMMQRRLVPTKIIGDQTTDATALLQTMPNETEEAARYKQFYGLLATLKATHRNLIDLTPAEESLLMNIANSRTKTAFKAQTCLYVARGKEFPVLLPTDSGIDYTVFKQDGIDASNNNTLIVAVPNPAQNQTTFHYHLKPTERGVLYLYNIMGQMVHQTTVEGDGSYTLDTSNYPSGVYSYRINTSEGNSSHERLIIVK